MLDDRHYMRSDYRGDRPTGPRLSVVLIIVNVVAFLLVEMGIEGKDSREVWMLDHFALSMEGLLHGYVWQLFTYQLMHGSIFHLVMNCLGLYFVGRWMEMVLVPRAFLLLYVGGGVFGGVLQALGGLLPFIGDAPAVGASASLMAILGAFCLQYYHQPFQLVFPPVTLTGRTFLIVFVVLDFAGLFSATSNVAHLAHLGGLAAGAIFLRNGWQYQLPTLRIVRRRSDSAAAKARTRPAASPRYQAEAAKPAAREDFMASEVDPILDKISAHGIHSLTDRERAILEKAQKNMSKR